MTPPETGRYLYNFLPEGKSQKQVGAWGLVRSHAEEYPSSLAVPLDKKYLRRKAVLAWQLPVPVLH